MKKFLSILVIVCCVVTLTGCGNNESTTSNEETKTNEVKGNEEVKKGTLKCSKTQEVSDAIKLDLVYNVTYEGDNVTYLETVEKVISNNSKVLKTYKEQIANVYKPYLDIEYYDNNIEISGDTLTSTTKIDYSKIDTNKLIEIDSSNKVLIKNGKVAVKDLKKTYESLNMTCE